MNSKNEGTVVKWIANIVLTVIVIFALVPFWLLISASITDEYTAIREGFKFIPDKVSLLAYRYLFEQWEMIGRAYGITIFVTVVGTVLSVVIVTMFAYGLSLKDVRGIKVVLVLVVFSMLFNGGIVPTYYVYTNLLHIKNTLWALIIPNLLMNGFTVLLVRNYLIQNIPKEIYDAAEIDGCSVFRTCFRIIFPLSTPILATIGLLEAIAYWNDWINGLYYITNEKLYSLQLVLNNINNTINFIANNTQLNTTGAALPSSTIRMSIAVVTILPILCAYPFFHKYFAKGIVMGSVKG